MNKRIVLIALILGIPASSILAQQPEPLLNLQRVVDTYVQNNLEIQAARFRIERTKADQIAARLRPNPGITVTAENLALSGPTRFGRLYEIGLTYSETIELGGKRKLRERAAGATVAAAEAQFEDTLRRGLAEVKRMYFDALLGRYNVEVAVENRQTFDQLVQFNQTRFQEGAIPEVELIKVRLERVKFDSAVKQAELSLRQTTIHLLERMGASNLSVQAIAGELDSSPVRPDLNSLREFASTRRPDILASLAEVNAAAERVALERTRGKADISPFAGYKRVGNDNTVMFGVSIPLTTRDRNQDEIARAEVDLRLAQTRLQLARSRALAELETAYAALEASRELVETFQSELLRQADESRDITLSAYEEGGIELLSVLEAQRTRTEVRRQYFKTLFDYQASIIALELAAGREIRP